MVRKFTRNLKEENDTGLANAVGTQGQRLINKNGQFNVERTGLHPWLQLSPSHELITMPWWKFNSIVLSFFLITNLLFASAYYAIGVEHFAGIVAETSLKAFQELFFFSTQTFTTVGYGRVNPMGFAVNFVAAMESLTGLMSFAIATGLIYGRFTRPRVQMLFSDNAIIAPYMTGTGLMFRLANAKNNDLSDVEIQTLASLITTDDNGRTIRKYLPLDLERKSVSALTLSWTVVHPITENSPFFMLTQQDLQDMQLELLISVKGFDTTFSQVVQTRFSYHHSDFVWNARFRPAFRQSENGYKTIVELDRLNDFETLTEQQMQEIITANTLKVTKIAN